ncbi:SlyX family protein [Rodentibacter pneumotropicus]|uniref:Protein SlyX homolog n=1 Tax=Rodentibacter pneumotropicus TaxID=758 RepID=A0A448MU52_9PAST|nr:SlyX family protein [Rodentibacter pneumotropicus]MDC2826014.1 SlyX family protein [Rodentibacter pneumotropicus]NBH75561.1 SlyX protein [Rodentibacter pneumotropicus]OOF61234.1 SlyX protein [Rodentibacter pneumotropicus]OOF63699.1 SlyX protein [Rodentibacter pneumotropicus]TGZ99775.1 SlyX protein [Rodentibacter pneumotropicus]
MQIQQRLENRITELETKVAFQEQLLEELNQALVQQQFDMDKMQLQLRYIANKLKDFQPSNIASQAEETPPPHY